MRIALYVVEVSSVAAILGLFSVLRYWSICENVLQHLHARIDLFVCLAGKKMSTDTVPHGNKQQRIDLKSRYDTGAWWAAPGTGAASGREIGAASYRYSYRYIHQPCP